MTLAVGRVGAFVGDEFEIFVGAGAALVAHHFPLGLVPHREIGVALEGKVALHIRDVHAVGFGEGFLVDFGATGDEAFGFAAFFAAAMASSSEANHSTFSVGGRVGVAADHEVSAAGEGSSDGGKSFAAHDHGVADGEAAEAAEVFGQVPRQAAGGADETFRSHRNYD